MYIYICKLFLIYTHIDSPDSNMLKLNHSYGI